MRLEDLNPEQRQAVEHIDGPLLLLAGAGSGKTKTLTTRLAYLIKEIGIPASSILCLTFTNKASQEMRERALRLIGGDQISYPLLCTFHKFGLMFLKKFISLLDRPSSFVLLDRDDVKKIIQSFKSPFSPSVVISYISYYKNQILSPQEVFKQAKSEESKLMAELYDQYQTYLNEYHLLDFDDLLYLSYLILEKNPSLAQEMSKQYQYIMVDEYQDTNFLQYKLLRLLTCAHQNLCVVGDEDQSIYGWRGADIRNILEFEKDFKEATVIKLEKNYRSTPQILQFANQLISCNTQRLGKTLFATKEDGEEVQIFSFLSEREEMSFVACEIESLLQSGIRPEEIAILYRVNALSRNVEEGLNRAKIPYKLIGSVHFYERAEVKDALSYLRLMVNICDDFSLLRVINKPKRGLGKVSQDKLQEGAKGTSIYQYFQTHPHQLAPKTYEVLKDFFALIAEMKQALRVSMDAFKHLFEKKIPLLDEYAEYERDDRKANLDELFGYLREFMEENPNQSLEDFLNDLSLSSESDKEVGSKISCMSMHSSKGLEFDYVFVIGCEDGVFPLIKDEGNLEEERRLGYVAFTRAKKRLCLSHVSSRSQRGKRTMMTPSRFLHEGQSGISEKREIQKNSLVRHKVFGIGRVQEVNGRGKEAKARVNFGGNERVILLSFLEFVQ
ncbi:ATP-dependent helicase [Helicobacter kayseriensis]|uniref:ATP-dependent helicase n=1 Tax=Helicobacter kayseriensis TaxID=2905877 RepID=UPI001E587777|nr:UvrD-helicase domain-containing protein [Helicobacter kayseriensis]MCE3048342.1 UvrD-helicase domain-containing protein [Helicobacter kayseriensis]